MTDRQQATDEDKFDAEEPSCEAKILHDRLKSKEKKKKKKKKKNIVEKTDDVEVSSTEEVSLPVRTVSSSGGTRSTVTTPQNSNIDGSSSTYLERVRMENVSGLLTGRKEADMAGHKFWQTQPVPRFGEGALVGDGEITKIEPEHIRSESYPLISGFEWDTMNLEDESQLAEVYDLLSNHYVEDEDAMFRFNYSGSFLNWALKAPGWRKDWHVGVRASSSRKLLAFISGIPIRMRIRKSCLAVAEINFLCIHKKLRHKRLAPVLIKEITRRCYAVGTFQAIYTAGIVLPKPVATCRYFHRSLDWLKLYQVGFAPLPPNSTAKRQIMKYKLPNDTMTHRLRIMQEKDVPGVMDLLKRYLGRIDMAQMFSEEEIRHWFVHEEKDMEKVIWAYVVDEDEVEHKEMEDNGDVVDSHGGVDDNSKDDVDTADKDKSSTTKKKKRNHKNIKKNRAASRKTRITDFISFYGLESSIINPSNHHSHKVVRGAYLFYYATEAAFPASGADEEGTKVKLRERLNDLISDTLILAKNAKFDVFNALTLLDNPLFLEKQCFGAGDGQLHYYLFNYRAAPIAGGVDGANKASEKDMGGVGIVML